MHPECGFQIVPNWPNLAKNDNDATIFQHDVIANF